MTPLWRVAGAAAPALADLVLASLAPDAIRVAA